MFDKLVKSEKSSTQEVEMESKNEDKMIKYLRYIGYFNGICPLKNALGATSAHQLKFKKLSFVSIFSWIIFLVKFIALMHALFIMVRMNQQFRADITVTDIIVFTMYITAGFGFGLITHVLNVTGMHEYLDTIKGIHDFKEKYYSLKPFNSLKLRNVAWINLFGLSSILIVPYMIWYFSQFGLPKSGIEKFNLAIDGFDLGTDDNLFVTIMYHVVILLYVEISIEYLFTTLFILSETMKAILDDMITASNVKSETQNSEIVKENSYKSMIAWDLVEKQNERNDSSEILKVLPSWSLMSEYYLDFYNLFVKYQKYVAGKFITMDIFLIISIVATSYYQILSSDPLSDEFKNEQFLAIALTMYRITWLANIGETILKKHENLCQTLGKINQAGCVRLVEKTDFKKFFTIVKNMPVSLSAKGFFVVRRSNVTSITSVVITYIIILLQFKMSDKSLIPNSPTNMTVNGV